MRKRTTLAVAMLAAGAALTSPTIVWAGTDLVGATPTTTQASTAPSTVPSAPRLDRPHSGPRGAGGDRL